MKFPCEFGGGQYSSITVDSTSFPTRVTADAVVENVGVSARKARLILKDPANGDAVVSPRPGVQPSSTGVGSYRVVFDEAHIASLTDSFGNGNYRIAVEWDDSNSCMGISDAQNTSSGLPACCLRVGSPVVSRITNSKLRQTITETCGASTMRILGIRVDVDNASGGQQERFTSLQWNGTSLWTGNARTHFVDRSTDPLLLGSGGTAELTMDFNRNVVGDNVTVTYEYRIGGSAGTCTFTGRAQ